MRRARRARSASTRAGSCRSSAGDVLLRVRAGADRRRDGRDRAAARLPGQRPRRRDAPRRRAPPDPRLRSLKPGERAVVIAADDRGLERRRRARARRRRRRRRSSTCASASRRASRPTGGAACSPRSRSTACAHECDLLRRLRDARSPPTRCSPRPARASSTTRRAASSSRPTCPPDVEAVGRVAGELGAGRADARAARRGRLRLRLRGRRRQGPEARDRRGLRLDRARQALHDGDDGPVPGAATATRLDPRLREASRAPTRPRSARRPRGRRGRPSRSACWPGRPHEPAKRTALHHRHDEAGAEMIWTGAWQRPHNYGDAPAEAQHVHEARRRDRRLDARQAARRGARRGGVPRAAVPEPLRRPRGRPRPLQRALHRRGPDHGRRHDRAGSPTSTFYVTTTSTGADGVLGWFEWWNAVWRMDVEIVEPHRRARRGQRRGAAARASCSPRLTDADVSADGLKYLDAREAQVAGVPCLLLRIGFVGELGYELHFPSTYAEYLWDTLLERGAKRRSGSRRSGSSGSRSSTSSSARTPTPSRTCSTRTWRGSRSSTRTTSSASGRSST